MLNLSYVVLEIAGENKVRFINLCVYHGIKIWDIKENDTNITINMEAHDFFKLGNILKKTNIRVKIKEKKGIYFILKSLLNQKLFYLFFILSFFLLWFSSHFVWKIDFIGNRQISSEVLEDFLADRNIRYGMPIKGINTEILEKEIRKEFFLITWISVSINGTTLNVEIKENDTITKELSELSTQKNIISSVDGIVNSILVRRGTAKVKIGDIVKKGDILIEGIVDIPAEDGSIKGSKPVEAKGDVWITYNLPVREQLMLEYDTKVYTGKEKIYYNIYINNKFKFRKKKEPPFLKYDFYEEDITPSIVKKLFPDFKIYRQSYRDYIPFKEKYSLEEAEQILENNFEKLLQNLEEKGVQIIEKNVTIKSNGVALTLDGAVSLKEVCKENDKLDE